MFLCLNVFCSNVEQPFLSIVFERFLTHIMSLSFLFNYLPSVFDYKHFSLVFLVNKLDEWYHLCSTVELNYSLKHRLKEEYEDLKFVDCGLV